MLQKWTIAYTEHELEKAPGERLALAQLCTAVGLQVREAGSLGVTVQGPRTLLDRVRAQLAGRADIEPYRGVKLLAD